MIAGKRLRSIQIAFMLILTASLLIAPASAQESDQPLIVGNVSSNGLPVEGLDIVVSMAMGEQYIPLLNATTNSEGVFEFHDDLFGHSFIIEFQHGGLIYRDAFVSTNETYTVEFDLSGVVEFTVFGIDGRGVEGITVIIVDGIGQPLFDMESDASGSGSLGGLNTHDIYLLIVDHEGVPYTQVFDFVNSTAASVEIQFLETTTSDEMMEANMHHIVVDMDGEYLNIWEGLTFHNLGDRIINNSWLRIWIPPGAEDVDSDVMDCCVQTTDDGLIIDPMEPVFPSGTFETRVEYRIKAKRSKQVLTTRVEYDTPSFLYLIQSVPGVTVENPIGLSFDSERNLGGTDYLIYRAVDLEAGATVSVQFKGLVSWTDALMQNPIVWAAGLLAAPAGLLLYFFVIKKDDGPKEPARSKRAVNKKRLKAPPRKEVDAPSEGAVNDLAPVVTEPDETGNVEQEDLKAEESAIESVLEKIASDLDQGVLSESAYNRLKERYEERLAEVREKLEKSQ